MTATRTLATARRVLDQLRHDPRTIGLILVVPTLLMALLAWILDDADFEKYGPPLLGIFPMLVMFLVTSVATLRERTSGTLERLLSMPTGKGDFVFGYALAFSLLAVVQALVVAGVSFWWLGLHVAGSTWLVVLLAVVDGLTGTALGLFVSAFAQTEFQAVQFMPVALLPQLLLCGLIVPTDQLPPVLEWLSWLLPLTYTFDALQRVAVDPTPDARFWVDLAVVSAMAVLLLAAGAATLRRRTP
ncbi:MAG: ABC transporter permease subunit [Frankiales bacterium]|nr:ABC transporter permease subunit [Frankiales bacterium]